MVANAIAVVKDNLEPLLVANLLPTEIKQSPDAVMAGYEPYETETEADGSGEISAMLELKAINEFVNVGNEFSREHVEQLEAVLNKHYRAFGRQETDCELDRNWGIK